MAAHGDEQFTLQSTWLIVPNGLVDADELRPKPLQIFDTSSDLDTRRRGRPVH